VGQKILVVEDNELNLKLFCDLLGAHGYEAEPVRDGREALERARAFAPDLVVMDIQMPHISGLELIEQMKADAELRATPIMAVTAYAARGDEERIRDAGAEGYVSKPISVVRFVEAVAGLLTAAAERAEAEPEAAAADEEPRDEPPPPVIDKPPPETTDAAESDDRGAAKEDGDEGLDPPRHSGEMMGGPSPRPGDEAAPSWNPPSGGDGDGDEREEEQVDPGSSPG
jgi:two-component system cell cycle response regulator DivK